MMHPQYNPSGFDYSQMGHVDGVQRQGMLPGGWSNQGQAVSAPYQMANQKAAMKTNPQNAASQMPVGDRVTQFLHSMGR
jgi:beta-lactamase superfamily II metal-dependent hydrolase